MEIDADKVIIELKKIIADQAGQIALLNAIIEKLQTPTE